MLFWQGVRIPNIEPMMARIMIPLIRSGQAHKHAMSLLTGEDTDVGVIPVHILKLRRRLAAQQIPVKIETVNRYGYRLVLPEEPA